MFVAILFIKLLCFADALYEEMSMYNVCFRRFSGISTLDFVWNEDVVQGIDFVFVLQH